MFSGIKKSQLPVIKMRRIATSFLLTLISASLLLSCSHLSFKNGSVSAPENFEIIQLTSRTTFDKSSYLVLADGEGQIIGHRKFSDDKGIATGYITQVGNLVYFTNNSPGLENVLVYDYSTHSLQDHGHVGLEFPGFEYINPFSEKPFVTVNIGFGERGYQTGIGFLDNGEWKFLERDDKLEFRSGIVYQDKIYVYGANGEPPFDGDKILVYDKSFNQINEVDLFDELSLSHANLNFYIYQGRLFLMGEGKSRELSIVEVTESLQIKSAVHYPDLKFFSPCLIAEEEPGILYLELAFHGDDGKELYQGGASLIRIDFEDLRANVFDELPLTGYLLGINFEAGSIFVQEGSPRTEMNRVSIYDLQFNHLKTLEIEKYKGLMPHIIDINKEIIVL